MGRNGLTTLPAWTRAAMVGVMGVTVLASATTVSGGTVAAAESRSFITSDGARLHYLEAGPAEARTVLFVPGWTMPGWIFQAQIDALSDRFHVLALDPRGQGDSEVTRFGYTYERRGRDIGELIDHAANGRVVLVGWSLGVLDSLAWVAAAGDARIAGLVLIDNSIGEEPAPRAAAGGRAAEPPVLTEAERRDRRAAFVASMFARDPGTDYRARLTDQALRMTPEDERRLLAYDVPRDYWRAAVHSTDRPVLYVVRPRWRAQGETLVRTHADARMVVFEDAGHALFVDEADRFDRLLIDFLDGPVAARDAVH
ncbi:alpha/beta hydrolase [Brevundimonas sp. AJA228-03]|uniref:alpha/beta fold hydrolase n=1 Tax=Brevundimonas sp. AJA228-03 TaxID=2752515 RepID=UPI001AE035E6|nr:alpha/beta hydrolase [Brevundimonas sp. AJA228-03]QTN19294.1 alpha/beta hydrolase [Brevundimonas sp. AJA228-03]